MRSSRDHLQGLVRLARVQDADERRALWRQSMATLAAEVIDERPVPLEGLDPAALVESVRIALATRLLDDLGFLSPPSAAAALYALAAAVPTGAERRELGRRVLLRLHEGDAPTFVALATQIAQSSSRALSGGPIRARVALSLDLPLGLGAHADRLALALISRREMEREWLSTPSIGSLSSRRLAGRLLERAARSAARKAAQGDDSGVRVFSTASVKAAWNRLLADRESLVWRHVATARGLLREAVPSFADEIERDLDPQLTPTEWRRAAASLAASIAVTPEAALNRARAFFVSDVPKADRGVAGAMILGLPRAAEVEPEAVDELLESLVRIGGIDAIEALVELRRERLGPTVGAWASELARAQLREAIASAGARDDGLLALMEALHAELAPEPERDATTLPDRIAIALTAFAERSAAAACEEARSLVEVADGTVGMLLLCGEDDSAGRKHAFRALRELDVALLEKATLSALLMLGSPAEATAAASELGDVFGRLTDWLIGRESEPIRSAGPIDHLTYRLRRMRTLLHLVDAEGTYQQDEQTIREQRLRSAHLLLERVRGDAATPLRRVVCAAASRASDALVREEICEVSDVLMAVGSHIHTTHDLRTFAEASMVPEIETVVDAYAALGDAIEEASAGGRGERAAIDALLRLAHELPVASSALVEALRSTLLKLARALESVATSGSLAELAEDPEGTQLATVENAVVSLSQLVTGARRRLGERVSYEAPAVGAAIRMLDLSVDRALRGVPGALEGIVESLGPTLDEELPRFVARSCLGVLGRIRNLPLDAPRMSRMSFMPAPPREAPLPPWLPPSRILGGFHVLRPLGSGAVGTVYVARRAEHRHQEQAEEFALKVPEYNGAAARTLSEQEFLQLFRQEAGALMSLPAHPNLATFVTFDAGAQPKPILVMELVEGPSLQRLLETGDMDMHRALAVLLGVAAGLCAMHTASVGHLDVKPSNIILRSAGSRLSIAQVLEPVLVDFGLAGRNLRPGCGTGEYGAPEIWGAGPKGWSSPGPADAYAFACMVYETVVGHCLFEAPTEIALITAHLSHDGDPPGIQALGAHARTEPLARLLARALRRDPRDRIGTDTLALGLEQLRAPLLELPWPLRSARA